MPVGATVTLRGARMYEFLDRFITLAMPRIRDFRGLPNRSFDGRGNYTFGIKEQMIFPEIDYDKVEKIHGMDITLVTSTRPRRPGHGAPPGVRLAVPRRDAAARGLGDRDTMAKTAWIERAKRTPKFKVRAVRRCQRCGRSPRGAAQVRPLPHLFP